MSYLEILFETIEAMSTNKEADVGIRLVKQIVPEIDPDCSQLFGEILECRTVESLTKSVFGKILVSTQ